MVRTLSSPRLVMSVVALGLVCIASNVIATDVRPERVRQIAGLLQKHPTGLGEPITNRTEWDKVAAADSFKRSLRSAHAQLAQEIPQVSDELYLDYSRTGNRDHWQSVEFARRELISTFALAECLENRGEFLPMLEKTIALICSERTWVYPAHDSGLRNYEGKGVDIDLGSSRVAWELATADYLLGEKLSSKTRALIRENLQRRIFKPYRDMVEGRIAENSWFHATHNWNAVCLAGVTGAALATIDSREERAWFIAASEIYIRNFLSGFTSDGYCSEGMGYWNYGFGHFIMLGETIRQATHGGIDLLADPAARLPALFGQRAEILNGIYPSIADCSPGSRPDPQLTAFICERFQLKECDAKNKFLQPSRNLFSTAMFAFLPEKLPIIQHKQSAEESSLRTWFSEGGVLICRPHDKSKFPFAVSLKGGHNAEHHNHNDVGSFIVVSDKSMVLVDPGSEVYTARTFSSKRYESDVLNSFGHDVPVVAGQLQKSGAKARAKVTNTSFSADRDILTLDITAAYNVPTLTKLQRTFEYHRVVPSLIVRDEVGFTNAETFETALVSWGKWTRVAPSELLFTESSGSVRVRIDTGGLPFEITSKQLEAEVHTPQKATRVAISLRQPVTNAIVTMTISPEVLAETR